MMKKTRRGLCVVQEIRGKYVKAFLAKYVPYFVWFEYKPQGSWHEFDNTLEREHFCFRFDEMRNIIKNVRNHKKIKDMSKVLSGKKITLLI